MFVSPSERAQFDLTLVFLGPVAAHAVTPPSRQHPGARIEKPTPVTLRNGGMW